MSKPMIHFRACLLSKRLSQPRNPPKKPGSYSTQNSVIAFYVGYALVPPDFRLSRSHDAREGVCAHPPVREPGGHRPDLPLVQGAVRAVEAAHAMARPRATRALPAAPPHAVGGRGLVARLALPANETVADLVVVAPAESVA